MKLEFSGIVKVISERFRNCFGTSVCERETFERILELLILFQSIIGSVPELLNKFRIDRNRFG
jgi:hypothetical protein